MEYKDLSVYIYKYIVHLNSICTYKYNDKKIQIKSNNQALPVNFLNDIYLLIARFLVKHEIKRKGICFS